MNKFKKLGVIFTLAFVLCGCYKMNINVEVANDGKTSMSMDMLMQESVLDYMGQGADDLEKSFKEGMGESAKDVKFTKLEKTIDDDKYVGFKAELPKEAAEQMAKQSVKVEDKKIIFEMAKEDLDSLNGALGESQAGMGDADPEEMKAQGIELNFTVKMPGKIISTTAGEIDGNTVVVDLLTSNEAIKIESEKAADNTMLYIIGGVAAVVIIAGVVIFLKKKNKNDETDAPITTEAKTAEPEIKTEETVETVKEETVVENNDTETK